MASLPSNNTHRSQSSSSEDLDLDLDMNESQTQSRKHKRAEDNDEVEEEEEEEEQEEQENDRGQNILVDQHKDNDSSSQSRQNGSLSPNSKIAKLEARKQPTMASPALRKEQNRAAQRAFRNRKERHLQQLENMIRDLKEQQFHITARFQREVQHLKNRLESTLVENHYLREVVFAFETALSKGGHVAVLQDVKQELYRHHYEKQALHAQRTAQTMITTADARHHPEGFQRVSPHIQAYHRNSELSGRLAPSLAPSNSLPSEPPHPLNMPLSTADPSYEMRLYTVNREILYKAPPLFISVAMDDGRMVTVRSPLDPLEAPRPSFVPPGTHLPKHTDYTKHPTVFDELQSSLFPPGTLESLVQSEMSTPQEVVNDRSTLFDVLRPVEKESESERWSGSDNGGHRGSKESSRDRNMNKNGGSSYSRNDQGISSQHSSSGGQHGIRAYATKAGLASGNHRLQKEFNIIVSAPPAVDPHISPQIYELPHDSRIDLIPCPKLRAQMILHQNKYDLDALFQLLVDKAICHGHALDVSSWELPDEFFDRFGFLMGLDMERIRRKVWPRKATGQ